VAQMPYIRQLAAYIKVADDQTAAAAYREGSLYAHGADHKTSLTGDANDEREIHLEGYGARSLERSRIVL
jgi:hypothetical protein